MENLFNKLISFIQSNNGREYQQEVWNLYTRPWHCTHWIMSIHASSEWYDWMTLSTNTPNHKMYFNTIQTTFSVLGWGNKHNSIVVNQLSTLILQNQSPFNFSYKRQPDYILLHVFGCLCFPLKVAGTQSKFEPRSSETIFLGYAWSHKGYRCMDIKTKEVYISWHVKFIETLFLYECQQVMTPTKIDEPYKDWWTFFSILALELVNSLTIK